MILVGLTGGVATGKTTVARMFKDCGAVLIDADRLAREVVQPPKPAWRDIVKKFGKAVLNPDRTVNRRLLGAIVFHHPDKRLALERIIHPRVARRQAVIMKETAKKNPGAVVVYDVPLLFEAGIDKTVDRIVVVTADSKTQVTRLRKRNGITQAEAIRRIKSQFPLRRKITGADFILDGTSSRRVLRAEVLELFRMFRRLA